jgi:hypothetical protein
VDALAVAGIAAVVIIVLGAIALIRCERSAIAGVIRALSVSSATLIIKSLSC